MTVRCQVIDFFKTSIGDIAVLGFFDTLIPRPGMILKDEVDGQWKIIGVAMERNSILSNRIENKVFQKVWDCSLKNMSSETIKVGDTLYLES